MTVKKWQSRFQLELRKQLRGSEHHAAYFSLRAGRAAVDQYRQHGPGADGWGQPELVARLETVFLRSPGCEAVITQLLRELGLG